MSESRVNGNGSSLANKLERDSFGFYLDQIGRMPTPTHEEQLAMSRKVQTCLAAVKAAEDEHDLVKLAEVRPKAEEAVSEMVLRNLRLVPHTAKRLKIHAAGVELFDLVQDGSLGLFYAVENFDYSKGFKFSTYATYWIRQAMQRAAVRMAAGWQKPQTVVQNSLRMAQSLSRLEQLQKGTPSLAEIAADAHVDLEKAEEMLLSENLVYLDAPLGNGADAQTAGDLIGSNEHDPEEEAVEAVMRQTIRGLLDGLDAVDGLILKLYFGFEGPGLSHKKIGLMTGVTPESIRRRKNKALKELRSQYGKQLLAYLR